MHKATIDGVEISAEDGTTILETAERIGITIPTLCHGTGLPHHTSCMVCSVRDQRTGRMVPACSFPLADGMDIDTRGDEVRRARQAILALLLSEHVGDCDAPCERTCPARLRIPLMLRRIADGDWRRAHAIAREDLVLPETLGRICPAPCQKACHRGSHDEAVAIAALHRTAAHRAARERHPDPPPPELSGRRVAVVGAGPAGLAAAWHLRSAGVFVLLLDAAPERGGRLRDALREKGHSAEALDVELASLAVPGIEHRGDTAIRTAGELHALAGQADAVILAPGRLEPAAIEALGLERGGRGIKVDARTMQTSRPGVYAIGDAVHASRLAVRSVGDGRAAAAAVLQRLAGEPETGRPRRFNSRIGRMKPGEEAAYLPEASPAGRAADTSGWDAAAATGEAKRCLGCDCRRADTCSLRSLAEAYDARADEFRASDRPPVSIQRDHPDVVYESGKCIRCGLCVRITARAGAPLGMTFLARGYDVRVAPSFDDGLDAGLGGAAAECVEACPTAALAWRRRDDLSPKPET